MIIGTRWSDCQAPAWAYTAIVDTNSTNAAELRARFLASLTDEVAAATGRVVEHGARGGGVYVVGGVVRDLLLGRAIVDVDMVMEADAIDVVRAAFPDVRLTTHAAFRTASVQIGETWIDVATARTERYERPGALPEVAPAGIEADLARRDFGMNAMALRMDGEAAVLDPCGGIADVDARRVRALHHASFRDDGTRVLRAFRYAARLGFEIEAGTRAMIARDLRYVGAIGGERLRRELELAASEASAGAALEAMAAGGVLAAVHPALSWDARRTEAVEAARTAEADGVALGFALLAAGATAEEAEAIAGRLKLTREEAAAVRGVASLRAAAAMLRRPDAKPSGVVVVLDRYPAAAVRAFAATAEDAIAGQLALRYLEDWRQVKPILSGEDLIEMGVPEGPQVGRGLQLVRAARLDGWAADRDDERALVLRFAKSIRDSDAMRGRIDLKFHVN